MKWYRVIIFFLTVLTIAGCAVSQTDSSGGYGGGGASRSPSSNSAPVYGQDGTRTHPAAYLTEIFPVHREAPKRTPNPNAEFFFKSCSRGGERWVHSRTSYDCDYPF